MSTCHVVLMSNNFLSSIENSLLAVSVWPGKLNYRCVQSHAVRACQPNCVPRGSNYTCAVRQWPIRLQTDSSGSGTSLRLTRAILKNNLLVRRLASPDEGSSSRRILRPTPAIAPSLVKWPRLRSHSWQHTSYTCLAKLLLKISPYIAFVTKALIWPCTSLYIISLSFYIR